MPKIQPKISKFHLIGDLVKTDIIEELVNLCLKNGAMRVDLDCAIGVRKSSYHYRHKVVYVYTPKRVIAWGYVSAGGLFNVYVTPYWRRRGIGSMIVGKLKREMKRRKRHYLYSLPWNQAGMALYSKFNIKSKSL